MNLDSTELSELLGLTAVSVIYVKGVLIFAIEIPMIDNFEFSLYKLIPLPVKLQNNAYSIIVPNSEYTAVDKSLLLILFRVKCFIII